MKRSILVPALLSLSGIAALAAAATFAAAQSQAPAADQRRTIAGWLVEDLPVPPEDEDGIAMADSVSMNGMGADTDMSDSMNLMATNMMSAAGDYPAEPGDRIVSMSRAAGSRSLTYRLYPSSQSWPGYYVADSDGCIHSLPLEIEGEVPRAERARRTQAALTRALQEHERFCQVPAGSVTALLEGFEPAFALLDTWYERHIAERARYQEETFGSLDNFAMNSE